MNFDRSDALWIVQQFSLNLEIIEHFWQIDLWLTQDEPWMTFDPSYELRTSWSKFSDKVWGSHYTLFRQIDQCDCFFQNIVKSYSFMKCIIRQTDRQRKQLFLLLLFDIDTLMIKFWNLRLRVRPALDLDLFCFKENIKHIIV